ncbi:hypothetical protein SARC_00985 [Sphaeroforma arctica JP610]|uniref:N-acetyltransferase domain-containing protein n=1 Tax=Sphaeroforma arctica JP610 TaxID=667725 RepID=A0A0L0GCZ8_9EUKA|nr:hypothetical protein SARC_00985 [Sphaeroforma arctica JP610]KNC86890.1 hypothetical protein SARC_00985 [Sphaeroforma arctica JP610]|eukprot:XP_014160792.1 hypothetical protein SARC_00985 [Sphaeroforma arctica JP610]
MSVPTGPVQETDRFDLYMPIEAYDQENRDLLLDEKVTQYIPFLHTLAKDNDAFSRRRCTHRSQCLAGEGAFFDVVHRESGEYMASSGFREMHLDEKWAEWGIIVSSKWQRKGVCDEVYEGCIAWARSKGLDKVTASTWPINKGMLAFFDKKGWKVVGRHSNDYGDWVNLEIKL